jgi:hypothetical protein
MPGGLGAERVSNFSVSAFQRVSVSPRSYLTRSIGLRPGEETTWGRHNGITPSLSFIHNLSNVFPPELARAHPEYFPLVEGKRLAPPKGSWFWNPDLGREDVANFAAEQAKAYFSTHPDAVTFSLGVNDALIFGDSPETKALISPLHYFRGRPDFSPLVFTFMNRAAVELAKTYPDKYLGCLAYYWCENVPPFPVDPHVIPFLTADRSQSYDPAFRREEFGLQEKWSRPLGLPPRHNEIFTGGNRVNGEIQTELPAKNTNSDSLSVSPFPSLSSVQTNQPSNFSVSAFQRVSVSPSSVPPRRLGLYDYLDDYGFLVPRVPIHAFAEHIRHARRVGFTDYFGESSRNWGLDGPMPWVIAQLLRNPELDVDGLLSIYYDNFFQNAGKPMRCFFERCEEQWMRQTGPSYWLKHYRNQSQTTLFPPSVCAELRTLLDEAAAQANSDSVRQRVAFVADSFGVTERFIAFQAARDALSRAVLSQRTVPHSDVASGSPRPSSSPRFNSDRSPSNPSSPSRDKDSASSPLPSLPSVQTEQLFRLLTDYSAKRGDFIRYTHQITDRWHLAFSPINYDDWLRDDPSFAAAMLLQSDGPSSDFGLSAFQRFSFWSDAAAAAAAPDLPINGTFEGPLLPGRQIAGLQYGADLPAPWQSRIEPTQRSEAALLSGDSRQESGDSDTDLRRPYSDVSPPFSDLRQRVANTDTQKSEAATDAEKIQPVSASAFQRFLRVSDAENTTVYQWQSVKPGTLYVASVLARGVVSNSDMVTLTLGWLDAKMGHIGTVVVMRLPDGKWPDWVQLQQGARAPANAAYVGIGVRVMHQLPGDSVDFADFHLRSAP